MLSRVTLLVFAVVAVGLGCASSPPVSTVEAPVARRGERPPMRIVESAYGEEHSKKAEELVVPFAVNQNGTELVLVATEQAEKAGAAFLGDLAIVMTFKWGGTPVECTSKIVFEDDPVLQKKTRASSEEAGGVYSTQVEGYQPRLVDHHAEEQELFCTDGQRVTVRDEKVAFDRMDPSEGPMKERSAMPGGGNKVFVGETVLTCEKRPVVRDTRRYEHEIKLGFVPPDLAFLSSRLGGGRKLVQAPPVCFSLDEAELAQRPAYRLVARAFHQGPYRLDAPLTTPSSSDMDVYDGESLDTLIQRCVESQPKHPLGPEHYCTQKLQQMQRSRGRWGDKLWKEDE